MLRSQSAFLVLMGRGVQRGFLTVLRDRGWLTTLAVLFGISLLAQLLFAVGVGVQGIENILRTRTDLRLEIRRTATDGEIQEFYSASRQLPFVARAIFVTKEEAYEQQRKTDPQFVVFLEQFGIENPFPDTIAVTLKSLDNFDSFAQFARRQEWSKVVDPTFLSRTTNQEQEVKEMLRLTLAGRSIVLLFFAIMLAVLLFILMELVRRRALSRSEEVLVERLVGAHEFSILIPFATEGAVLLLFAFTASFAVLLTLLSLLPYIIPTLLQGSTFSVLYQEAGVIFSRLWPLAVSLEIICAPIFAIVGAWLGMHRILRSPKISLPSY